MHADVKNKSEPQDRAGSPDDARMLSLAETVGNMGHWHWHIQSDSMSWSDQVFAIFGQDAASYQPTFERFVAAFYEVDRTRVQARLDQSIREAQTFEFDARIKTPSGARNIIAKGQPEVDESGQVTAMFGVVTDVTDAFKTLQAVRDQKEMLDLAARVSGLGHWVWDPDQECLAFCSDHLGHMFETDTPSLLADIHHPSAFSEFLLVDDQSRYAESVGRKISGSEPYDIEYGRQTKTGVRRFREIGQPLVDADGNLQRFVATVQDVTEAKAREAELERARHELETLVAAKNQLFSIIGHDLKSPFNNIIGFASLLSSDEVQLSPEKIKEYGSLIVEAASNTNALLDSLLDWATVENADLDFRPIDFFLGRGVEESIRYLEVLAREKGVRINHKLDGVRVNADRDMVLTVFRNLINNAIKFSSSGDEIAISSLSPQAEGQVSSKDSTDYVHIIVSDSGVGMDANMAAAFLQGRPLPKVAGTQGETGSGLGLKLCSSLVRRHKGDLWIESEPDKGCAVHFTLPIAQN